MGYLSRYYLSRMIVTIVIAALFVLTGAPWWIAVGVLLLTLAFFLWAPASGRYVVRPELGARGLQRDERTQTITHQAARNGFMVVVLALGLIALFFGTIVQKNVPVLLLNLVLALGFLTYFVSDLWLRRP